MALKSSTSAVRTSYIQCMLACFQSNTIAQAVPLVPTLQKSIERAISQPTQAVVVTEGLCAAYLLLKISAVQSDKENTFLNLSSVLFDMDKQVFVSEKYLSTATDDGKLDQSVCKQKYILFHFSFILCDVTV